MFIMIMIIGRWYFFIITFCNNPGISAKSISLFMLLHEIIIICLSYYSEYKDKKEFLKRQKEKDREIEEKRLELLETIRITNKLLNDKLNHDIASLIINKFLNPHYIDINKINDETLYTEDIEEKEEVDLDLDFMF